MSEKSEFPIRVDRNVYPRPERQQLRPNSLPGPRVIPALGRAVNT